MRSIAVIILFFPLNSWAQFPKEGLHILAGAGLNTATYRTNSDTTYLGWGSHFKTDVGWYHNENLATEIGATVKFSQVSSDIIWDTLFTLGLRYRVNDFYFRGYGGSSVLVIVLSDGNKSNNHASRIHMDGPALGLGFGQYKNSQSNRIWFWEVNSTAQYIRHRDEVIMDGETPVIIASTSVNDDTTIYSLQLSVGFLLF